MIVLFAFAASIAMVPPDLSHILDPDDYPAWAMIHNESAAAIVDLLIDPNGRVIRCQSGEYFGSKQLAKEVCGLAKGKRVGPARDPAGNNIHGVAHTLLQLWLPDTDEGREVANLKQASDVVLTVDRLPGGATKAEAEVVAMVDQTGKVLTCAPSDGKVDEVLARTVCTASDQLGLKSIAGPDGQSVSYVTKVTVELTTKPLSPPSDSSGSRPR